MRQTTKILLKDITKQAAEPRNICNKTKNKQTEVQSTEIFIRAN
jgi:hypothetical protein